MTKKQFFISTCAFIFLGGCFLLFAMNTEPKRLAGPLKSESQLQALTKDTNLIKLGKSLYIAQCGRCHGPGGKGGIGSNLSDKTWIHGGGSLSDIEKTIVHGVQRKGMPAWGYLLNIDQIDAITVYVKSLSL